MFLFVAQSTQSFVSRNPQVCHTSPKRKKHHSTASFLVKSSSLRFFYCPHFSVCNIAAVSCWWEPPPLLSPPIRLSVLSFFLLELRKNTFDRRLLEPSNAIKQAAVIQGPRPSAPPHHRDSAGRLGFMFLRRACACPIIPCGSRVVADVIPATSLVVKEWVSAFLFFYVAHPHQYVSSLQPQRGMRDRWFLKVGPDVTTSAV